MTKTEIAKAKKAERNARAYEANKQKIAEQNAQKKDDISLKNKESYEKNKELIADKYQKNKEAIKKAREKKIKTMSHKQTDEFKEKNCEYAREYYEKNKDMIKEKKEEREIAKAIEQEPRRLAYRKESIRLHKLDPLLHPYNPETDLSEPKKKRMHTQKNIDDNKIISVIQPIEREIYEPIPIKKLNYTKAPPKAPPIPPQQPIPVLRIATETSSSMRIFSYYDEDLDEDVSFEEMPEEELYGEPRDEDHKKRQREYKLKKAKYNRQEQERKYNEMLMNAELEEF